MKAVVVELRVTSLNRQRSHTHRLMNVLLDDSIRTQSLKGLRYNRRAVSDHARNW